MNSLKKAFTAFLILTLLLGLNINSSYASDSITDSKVIDEITYINSIQNVGTQEKLLDLISIEYLEVEVINEDVKDSELETKEEILNSDKNTLNDLKCLSKLDDNHLEKIIKTRIQEIIDKSKQSENIIILPSSYEVMEKYNFANETASLKKVRQQAVVSSTDTVEAKTSSSTLAETNDYKGWEKTAKGYIRNGSKKIVATYTLTVQWYMNSKKKIYYWDLYHGGSSNKNYYKYVGTKVNYTTLVDDAKTLLIQTDCKYKKTLPVPSLVPQYNHILVNADCNNRGGFSSSYTTYASYD